MRIALPDEAATTRLGDDLAMALVPGDVVRLQGDLGAGKTALARAVIRAIAADPELEVPSPTFTLVQSYTLRFDLHHCDLYRLAAPDELDELGFDELAETGVVLVEWPERADDRLDGAALTVRLDHHGDGRLATIDGEAGAMARLARSLAARRFLDNAGRVGALRHHLQGDASYRTYETVTEAGARTILMNAPAQPAGPPLRDGRSYNEIAHRALSVTPFVAMADALRARGFCAPRIEAADLDAGFLLLEHLGTGRFLSATGEPVAERYCEAARLLAALHGEAWPDSLPVAGRASYRVPPYDRDALMVEAELFVDWYVPHVLGRPADAALKARFATAWNTVFDTIADAETGIVLRDYHSPNFVWRSDRIGFDRIGLLDFQDALIGPVAYDLASLAQDARVSVPEGLERQIVSAYCAARQSAGPFDSGRLERDFAVMAAQRNSKILGIFVRLDRGEGKAGYLRHLPRIRAYLERALRHPALAPVAAFYRDNALLDAPAP
ncbi:tRNA (adenosine(37)-N6)-threonylcarbamoyltransferase complex ATPase subunit type 1 TsaE [Nitratireductor alexandrii]|uniref:tRNA (adenosine(37)-N6)-threonylcarbamoyltransferase complex ATPase subunit type 1 TsaE n=1 Tax=Nitratireductor alexandrii TaxID=2448161 RepID=UPI0023AB1FC1|nr:tRNA (adenosine(37)-N6)-threonylcarbamoyltransferase complex ATPase subunit type 1 TsaE [Nitratireductor alexandrii]